MAGKPIRVRIGPVWVNFKGSDLGYTKGGTTITRQFITKEIVVKDVPEMIVCIRKEMTAEVLMAETAKNLLQTVLNMSLDRGADLMANKGTLILTAKDDIYDVTTFPDNAFPLGNLQSVPFMLDKERVWPVTFRAIYTVGDFYFTEIS